MKTLRNGAIIMGTVMDDELNKLNKQIEDATEKFLDRRALIFIEEAISNYMDRHGVKKTRQYLEYTLEFLNEFETEEK